MKIKLWRSAQANKYFWYTLILSIATLVPISTLAISNNWLSIALSMAFIVTLVAVATITGKRFFGFSLIEDVISHNLSQKNSYLIVNPENCYIVPFKDDLNRAACIEYGKEKYYSNSPIPIGYIFSAHYYQPGILYCVISFTNSKRDNLIFVAERIGTTEYITTVYGFARK